MANFLHMATENAYEVRGDVVAVARSHKEWTQLQLAAEAHVSPSTVQRAEKSDGSLSYRSLSKIAKALGVHMSAICDAESLPPDVVDLMERQARAEDDEAAPAGTDLLRVEAKLDALLALQLGLPGARDDALAIVNPSDPRGST